MKDGTLLPTSEERKRVMREDYEWQHAHKLDNLDEMGNPRKTDSSGRKRARTGVARFGAVLPLQRVATPIPGQGAHLGCGFSPQSGHEQEATG